MSLKNRISSPLEAGTSLLDAHQLPPRILPALEHTSSRLARRGHHITLVVIRRDYHLPSSTVVPVTSTKSTPLASPFVRTPITPSFSAVSTPKSARFGFSILKGIIRSGSVQSPRFGSRRANTFPTSNVSSPMMPMTPATPMSLPPMTPSESVMSDFTDIEDGDDEFGLRFVHDGEMNSKSMRALQSALAKSERAYDLGSEWLGPALSPEACGLTKQLVQKSIIQRDILFDSEGLTLVSLDRLYSLKAALSNYSKTRSILRLEDAVDELRRLVLANNNQKVNKGELLRSYDWLSVSDAALLDVDRMYQRAYGGPRQVGGITGVERPMAVEPMIRDAEEEEIGDQKEVEIEELQREKKMEIGVALTSLTPSPPVSPVSVRKHPSPKPPVLKIQTAFLTKPTAIRIQHTPIGKEADEDDWKSGQEFDDGDQTARPVDEVPIMFPPWGGSIDQVLSAGALLSPLGTRCSMRMGPVTPNGYDDISPVTRGEWGFLTTDSAFRAKTARIETC